MQKRMDLMCLLMAMLLVSCGGDSGQSQNIRASKPDTACDFETDLFIEYARNNLCLAGGAPEKIFVLLDGTDGFLGGTKSWIKTNVFNEKTMAWTTAGAEISIAHLSDRPVADLAMTNICLPKPRSQIDYILDNPQDINRDNAAVQCVIPRIADEYLNSESGASKSVLVEAVAEVFKNPAYRFDEPTSQEGTRKFYFVSDLFQNSNVISFYKLCRKQGAEQVMTCPNYDDMVSSSPKLKRYLDATMPELGAQDEIHIYNINVNNRIDQSAREFWEQYFIEAGADASKIFFRNEPSR